MDAALVCFARSQAETGSDAPDVRPRRGQPGDVPTMVQQLVAASLNPIAYPPSAFIVLEHVHTGEIVAFGKLSRQDGNTAKVSSVLVRQEYRGRGLGKRLLAELLSDQEDGQQRDIWLTTLPSRKRLYEQFGFTEQPVQAAPSALQAERALGTPLARTVTGEPVIAMMKPRVRR